LVGPTPTRHSRVRARSSRGRYPRAYLEQSVAESPPADCFQSCAASGAVPRRKEPRMQILNAWFIAAVAAIQTYPVDRRVPRPAPVLVRPVFAGDTPDASMLGRVRLLGIDAPEIGRGFDTAAPFSREA